MTERVPLRDCPTGLFLYKGTLCLRTQYSVDPAYVVSSGEIFTGGAKTHLGRLRLMVTPITAANALDADFVEQAYREGHSDGRDRGGASDEHEDSDWRKSITYETMREMGYE